MNRSVGTSLRAPLKKVESPPVEFIPERLLFGCFSQVPAKNPQHHYFNVDSIYTYEPVVSEWGPLTISQIVRFGRDIDAKMMDPNLDGKIIYFWSGAAPTQRTNSALLISAYMLLFHEQTPEQAHKPLESMKLACIPFRDASNMPRCTYKLTVLHCLQAIDKARRSGIFDHRTFDVDRFDYYSYPGHGDVSEIVPGKIYAFSGPTHMSKESRFTLQFSPAHYFPIFETFGVKTVVRLNNKCYPALHFAKQGIAHHELFFTDGSPPPLPIARKFVEIVESTHGAIAIHCKAGLGRTGSCIAVYLMYHYRWTHSDAIAWIRLCRPASIIGPQQDFLEQLSAIIHTEHPESLHPSLTFFASQPHATFPDHYVAPPAISPATDSVPPIHAPTTSPASAAVIAAATASAPSTASTGTRSMGRTFKSSTANGRSYGIASNAVRTASLGSGTGVNLAQQNPVSTAPTASTAPTVVPNSELSQAASNSSDSTGELIKAGKSRLAGLSIHSAFPTPTSSHTPMFNNNGAAAARPLRSLLLQVAQAGNGPRPTPPPVSDSVTKAARVYGASLTPHAPATPKGSITPKAPVTPKTPAEGVAPSSARQSTSAAATARLRAAAKGSLTPSATKH